MNKGTFKITVKSADLSGIEGVYKQDIVNKNTHIHNKNKSISL